MQFDLIHAGRYAVKQKSSQVTEKVFMILTVSGLENGNLYYPSGRHLFQNENLSLNLIPQGFKIDFSYNEKRENFVIICNIPELKWSESKAFAELEHCGTLIKMPFHINLSQARCFALRERFIQIIALQNASIPSSFFAAEQQSVALLGEFASAEMRTEFPAIADIAEKFRQAIDDDVHFHDSLSKICARIGSSLVHARRLFRSKYRIDPGAYRSKRKLSRIMELLNQSSLSPKEIAEEVGMKNVTHLYSFLHKHCGQPPGSLRKRIWENRENRE